MGDSYSYVGAVVGATYPEMGKVLRKAYAQGIYSGSRLWKTKGRKMDLGRILVHFFNRRWKTSCGLPCNRGKTGTEEFSQMKAGDTIPVIGPLGNGFPFEKAEGKKVFLMGGGIGVPPILELAKQMECEKSRLWLDTVMHIPS